MVRDADEAVKTDAGESVTAMVRYKFFHLLDASFNWRLIIHSLKRLRLLENELNKAELKHSEAVTIQRTYNQIKSHLLSESLTYSNRLDELEKQIQAANEELKKLKIINKDAFIAKENVSNEYSKFEDKVYR